MITNTLLILGIILLLGLTSSGVIRKIKMPSITAYLLLGIFLGPHVSGIISESIVGATDLISNIVLSLIAFSIGQNFSRERFYEIGNTVISIAFGECLGAIILVTASIMIFTDKPLFIAMIFGAIATATAPAAVVMVVREFRARGRFTDTLLGVVALDDGIGLILFALIVAIAKSLSGGQTDIMAGAVSGITHGLIEIIGAVIIGAILGWVLSILSKHVKSQAELLIFTLGFIFLNAGFCLSQGFSLLLSNMAMAGVVINLNKTGFKFFESIRNIDSPFYLIFFVLAGANLEIGFLKTMGILGIVYVTSRLAGKIVGVLISAQIIGAPKTIRNYLGLSLAPQAGVALGMAMMVKGIFPEEGSFIMSTIIATTVIYEIIGPILTKYSLQSVGEIGR